ENDTEVDTIVLNDTNNVDKADVNVKTASVNILDKRSYLVGFYGFGPADPNHGGTITFGSAWLDELVKDTSTAKGYIPLLKKENEGRDALVAYLGAIDANNDKRISSAEAESGVVRVTGYSFGALQA